jgi:YVTN family beta-propeller protein
MTNEELLLGGNSAAGRAGLPITGPRTGSPRRARRATLAGASLAAAVLATTAAPAQMAGAVSNTTPAITASPTLLVTNSQTDTVSVVTGGKITATVKVGNGPTGIAVTPDGKTALVANFGFFKKPAYTVTAINVATLKAVATIKVGAGPLGVAIAPNGKTAVVTLQGPAGTTGDQVVVVNLATDKVVATLVVGKNPEAVAITPNGSTAYVADLSSAEITPVNLTTSPPTVGSPIALPAGSAPAAPRAIAISPNGATAYVLDGENNAVIPVTLATRKVGAPLVLACSSSKDEGCAPSAIAIDPSGTDAYVAAAGSGDVVEVSLASMTVAKILEADAYPDAVALYKGDVFVANGESDTLTTDAGSKTTELPGFEYPYGVAVVS